MVDSGFLKPRYPGAPIGYSPAPQDDIVATPPPPDETLDTGVKTTVKSVEETHGGDKDTQTPDFFQSGVSPSAKNYGKIRMYEASDVNLSPKYSDLMSDMAIDFDNPFTFSSTEEPIFGETPSLQLTGSGSAAAGLLGAVTGTPLGAFAGLGTAVSKAVNAAHQSNAQKSLALGGGGAFFEVENQRVSRPPDQLVYSGQIGYSNQQMAVVESIARGFVPGTLEINKVDYMGTSKFEAVGQDSGFSPDDMMSMGGAYNSKTGNFHSLDGTVSTFGTMAAGKAKAAQATSQLSSRLGKMGITSVTRNISVADVVSINRGIRSGKYDDFDDGLDDIAEDEAISQGLGYAGIEDRNPDGSTGDSSSGGDSGTHGSDMSSEDRERGPTDPSSGGPGGFRAMGGRVGLQMGGMAGRMSGQSGFVERPPSQVPEGETVADDVETALPEGSFVINAAAVQFAGEEDIKKMLLDANKEAVRRGITVDKDNNNAKIIDVAISRGEVVVAPHIAKIIGYDRLEKINNRGKRETKKRIKENGQEPTGAAEGGLLQFLFGPPKEEEDKTEVLTPETHPEFIKGFVDKKKPSKSTSSKSKASQLPPTRDKPSQPLPPLTKFETTAFELLDLLEGNKSEGYVPEGSDISGVTIGLGFDLGQHKIEGLERMGIDTDLISKLAPYVEKTGDEAREVLKYEPLSVTESEKEDLNKLVFRSKYERFRKNFPEYDQVYDDGKKAVLYSIYHLGALGRYETFRKIFDKAQDLKPAIKQGVLSRTRKGNPEHNRAKKALDWYEKYEDKNMEMPVPKPKNLSATR